MVIKVLKPVKFLKPCLAVMLASSVSSVWASDLQNAANVTEKSHANSAKSQQRIDASSEKTLTMRAEIEQLEQEIKNLEVYRDHLTALLANQEEEVVSFESQIDEIQDTRQGVVPLMYQMIDALASHIEQDVPIRVEARNNRVSGLQAMMSRADVSDAEKYRRILEAYMIEMDYGTKIAVYQGNIEFEGQQLDVEKFYLGRLSLLAKSSNGARYWSWDQSQNEWLLVDAKTHKDLEQAFRLADKQIAPTLLTLPVSLTSAEVK